MTERLQKHLIARAKRGEWDAIFQLNNAGIPIEVDEPEQPEPYRSFDERIPRVSEPEYRSPRLILPEWQKM